MRILHADKETDNSCDTTNAVIAELERIKQEHTHDVLFNGTESEYKNYITREVLNMAIEHLRRLPK